MFGILEAVAVPHSGVIYNSYEDLIKDLNDRASKEGYKIVKARSHRRGIGGSDIPGNEMVRCDLVCDRGGRPYKSQATKHKTSTKKTDCPWKAKAVHRKSVGGWLLTIGCDQHNHEPGTPEPPSPVQCSDGEEIEGEDAEGDEEGPQPDPETSSAMQLAGVSTAALRLTGDTFHQFKGDYRKMSQAERLSILSQLQLRIAAIYAVQNEDVQRNRRQEAVRQKHAEIDAAKRQRQQQKKARRQQAQQPAQQPPQPQQHPQSTQHTPVGTPGQVHMQTQQLANHMSQQQNQVQHQQHQAHLAQQQFQLPDSPSQQLISIPGMNMGMPQQAQYPGPPKRMRGSRPSQGGQPNQQPQQ